MKAAKHAIVTLQQLGTEQRQGVITLRGTELAGALPAVYRSAPRAGSVTSVVARSDSATPMSC